MACLREMICSKCGNHFLGNISNNRNLVRPFCNKCSMLEADTEKKKWLLDRRNGKTLEQRIAWLEEEAYNHSKVQHGYIDPPKF